MKTPRSPGNNFIVLWSVALLHLDKDREMLVCLSAICIASIRVDKHWRVCSSFLLVNCRSPLALSLEQPIWTFSLAMAINAEWKRFRPNQDCRTRITNLVWCCANNGFQSVAPFQCARGPQGGMKMADLETCVPQMSWASCAKFEWNRTHQHYRT